MRKQIRHVVRMSRRQGAPWHILARQGAHNGFVLSSAFKGVDVTSRPAETCHGAPARTIARCRAHCMA
jgi:hypothetical protein